MKRQMSALTCCLLASVAATAASPTATLLKNRASYNADIATAVKQGKWVANFAKAKKYATDNKVPLVAVWSNGDSCGHCTTFEGAVNSSTFKSYMKSSGVIFYFVYFFCFRMKVFKVNNLRQFFREKNSYFLFDLR